MPSEASTEAGPDESDSNSARLIRLALEVYRLGVSTEGTPFVVPLSGGSAQPFQAVARSDIGAELAEAFYDAYGCVPSASTVADALRILEVRARRKTPEEVHLRIARHRRSLVFDLARPDGRVVALRHEDWKIRRRSPVLFWRTDATGEQQLPTRDGSVHMLRELLNVGDDDWELMLGWLVAAFIPDIARPILLIRGEQGTGKSTAMRMLRACVDPSPIVSSPLPRRDTDFAAVASAAYLLMFDNVREISAGMSDVLCRAVTGDAHVSRRYYTNYGLSFVAYRRVMAVDGIDIPALRGDLADRVIPIELQPISPSERESETELAERFVRRLPGIFGALLTLTGQVRKAIDEVEVDELPRMADFAEVLAALDNVEGSNALQLYLNSRHQLAREVLESDQVALGVIMLAAEDEEGWTGTMSELLVVLTDLIDTPPRDWPRSPNVLSVRLKHAQPTLRSNGIEIVRRRVPGNDRRREITISRTS
jgi:hypothetical protein